MDVYKSMGIFIPRDADWQELSLTTERLTGKTHDAKMNAVKSSPPGSLLFKNGHVMMYLGTDDNGEPLIIHSASSYFDFSQGNRQKIYVRQVLVSDLHYRNYAGEQTIDSLTSVGKFF